MKPRYSLVLFFCFLAFLSCGNKKGAEDAPSEQPRIKAVYEGICRIYTGPKTHITHYIELDDGGIKEIEKTDGDSFVGKRVRMTVLYKGDGIHFDILDMVAISPSDDTNENSNDAINTENRLISGIRSGLADAESELRIITADLAKAQEYCEEKEKDLPFLQASYREDEKKRIAGMAREARENIQAAFNIFDALERQADKIGSITWVSDRRAQFTQEVESKIRAAEAGYHDTIRSYKHYFDNLNY